MSDIEVTKTELLRRIEEGYKSFEQVLSTWNDDQLTKPGPEGWSVKDHLVHLAAWEVGIAALLRKENRWEAMGLDKDVFSKIDSEDELNALIQEKNRKRSLAEVRAAFEDAHRQMVNAINDLTDADLVKPYSYYQPDEPGEPDNRPIWPRIVGNSYGHYEEHTPWIKAVVDFNSAK
jgi:hypothetical protein